MSAADLTATPQPIGTNDLRTRLRLLIVLFVSSALNRTGFIAVFTVTALAADDMLGSARWSGLAAAFGTLGLALGTTPLAALMARRGRRPGFVVGLSIAVIGATVAAYGVRFAAFPVLLMGLLLFGFGNSADRLGRYAAADIAPVSMRSSAIAAVVWAGTIGSVAGPLLLPIGARLVEPLGFSEYGGGFAIGAIAAATAGVILFVALRPDPLTFLKLDESDVPKAKSSLRPVLGTPIARFVLTSLAVGQAVMVLVMSMTPVHVRRAGEGLAIVGLIIGVHTFGMFFFSPISGYLADHFGGVRVILAGQLLLLASALAAAPAGGEDLYLLLPALFLLGLGWNLGFVAGSSLVTTAADNAIRVRFQGFADTTTWVSGALAWVLGGILLEWIEYSGLSLFAGALVGLPLLLRYRYRDALRDLALSESR